MTKVKRSSCGEIEHINNAMLETAEDERRDGDEDGQWRLRPFVIEDSKVNQYTTQSAGCNCLQRRLIHSRCNDGRCLLDYRWIGQADKTSGKKRTDEIRAEDGQEG